MAGIRAYVMRMAKDDADKSWLPQTVVQYDDPDFPFRSFWFDHTSLEACTNATFYRILDGSNGPYGDGGYAYQFDVESVKDVKVVYRDGRAPELYLRTFGSTVPMSIETSPLRSPGPHESSR